jgi:hypothetical protein
MTRSGADSAGIEPVRSAVVETAVRDVRDGPVRCAADT